MKKFLAVAIAATLAGSSASLPGLQNTAFADTGAFASAEAPESLSSWSFDLEALYVDLAAETRAATCARQSDWYQSCTCPSGYQVIVHWTSTGGTSNLWQGKTRQAMWTNSSTNPYSAYGAGAKAYSTGHRGPVYYGTGQGGAAANVKSMYASCSRAL